MQNARLGQLIVEFPAVRRPARNGVLGWIISETLVDQQKGHKTLLSREAPLLSRAKGAWMAHRAIARVLIKVNYAMKLTGTWIL